MRCNFIPSGSHTMLRGFRRGDETMRRRIDWVWMGLGLMLAGAAAAETAHKAPDPALVARARKLLDEVPLIDGHNDLAWEYRKREKNHLEKSDLRGDTSKLDPPMHTDIQR